MKRPSAAVLLPLTLQHWLGGILALAALSTIQRLVPCRALAQRLAAAEALLCASRFCLSLPQLMALLGYPLSLRRLFSALQDLGPKSESGFG